MPYKCVHCSKTYEDGSQEILTGCAACGRKFFFFIKKEKLDEINQKGVEEVELSQEERDKIEEDVRQIAGINNIETPVFLDFESIKVVNEGKYLLDLPKLFSKQPQVYQLEDGKYIVDFTNIQKKKEDSV